MRRVALQLAHFSVVHVLGLYAARRRLVGDEGAWTWVSERAATWAGPFGIWRRRALYLRLLPRVGRELVLGTGVIVTKPTTEFGHHVYVGPYTVLGDVRLGDHVLVANSVSMPSGTRQHGTARLDVPVRSQPGLLATIHVGEDTWIGSGATVLADVGAHCIVGAGAVVTKPVADYAVVGGNPARPIRDRRDAPS
jgi:virginiamycin A acetyltransferase